TTRYGLSRSLPAWAKWLRVRPSPPKMTAKTNAPRGPCRELPIKLRDLRAGALMFEDDTRARHFRVCVPRYPLSGRAPNCQGLRLFVVIWRESSGAPAFRD